MLKSIWTLAMVGNSTTPGGGVRLTVVVVPDVVAAAQPAGVWALITGTSPDLVILVR